MGIVCTLDHFLKTYGGNPRFNPSDYSNSNLDEKGIEGQIIEHTSTSGFVVRLFWYREFDQLGIEYEDSTPLAKSPKPKLELLTDR